MSIDFDDFEWEAVDAVEEFDLPAHTRLSASGAERWMVCTASQQMAERLGLIGVETDEAAEGTAAHELAATCLEDDMDAWMFLGQEFYNHEVTENMSLAVQEYLEATWAVAAKFPDCTPMIETRIDNKELHPDFGGTADWALITPEILFVDDYKHGIGVSKSPVMNPQLMYYGFGIYWFLPIEQRVKIKRIILTIAQPRDFNPAGSIRSWSIDADDLEAWAFDVLLPAMRAVDGPFGDLHMEAGEHCRFCPTKIGCPMLQAMSQAAATADPEDAKLMTNEELSEEYSKIKVVRIYLKALQDEAHKRAKVGEKIESGKMIQGRFKRVFPSKAQKQLKTQFGKKAYMDKVLKSPAQVEKMAEGKTFVAKWGHKIPGTMNFVPAEDSGKAITISPPSETFKGIKKGPR